MLNIFSIVFNGMPYISRHLEVFEQLKTDWRWIVVHGPANNGGSTSWCTPQSPSLSTDGTGEYLAEISRGFIGDGKEFPISPRIIVTESELWPSKDAMVQAALNEMHEPGILFQVDSDELWLAEQLEKIVELFDSDPSLGAIKCPCRYFVGPDLICVGENCWSNKADEYYRAWRFVPGMKAISHEPPVFDRQLGWTMHQSQSGTHGLVFEHYAYVTEAQVAYKEKFYGYEGAVEGWRRLQAQREPVVPLRLFFPWVDDKVMVSRLNLPVPSLADVPVMGGVARESDSDERITSPVTPAAQDRPRGGQRLFTHSGDHGDCIAALPAIRALGGGDLIITDGAYGQRESMKGPRFDAIKPLLEAQPYIKSVRWEDNPTGVTHDFRGFRKLKDQMHGVSLAQWQWQYIGLEGKANLEPWLTIEPCKLDRRHVLFARSLRYHNPNFPWRELLDRFNTSALFVGLPEEFLAFSKAFGRIPYWDTPDLLALAEIIEGCSLIIANQSCPFWIAAGLGVPTVQETWAKDQNSIVNRPNALYSRTDYETSKLMEKIERML